MATLFTEVPLVVDSGLVMGVALDEALVDGVVDLRSSFLLDLGVHVAFGVAADLGVELLFSLPALLPERGILGVNLTCVLNYNSQC